MAPSSSALRKPAAARSSASSQLAALSSPLSRTSGWVSRCVPRRHASESSTGEPRGRAPSEHVLVRARPLVLARVQLLRAQVGTSGDERLEQRRIVERRREHVGRERPVEVQQVRCASRGRARPARRSASSPVAPGSGRGARSRVAHAELVERVERDPPVGRQLAARDAEHPGRAGRVDGLAARARGRARRRLAARAARRTRRAPGRGRRTASLASIEDLRTSSSVTEPSSGSPSCSVSVVPSSSIPSHGTAKLTRTLSCGIVTRGAPVLAAVDDDVHALAQPHRRRRVRILEPPDPVDPRPGRVHDRASRDTAPSGRRRSPRRRPPGPP